MIIRMTIDNNNDFTQVIEKYFEEYGPWYTFNYNTMDEASKFKKLASEYDNISKAKRKEIKPMLEILIKNSFVKYISDIKPNSRWETAGYNAKELQADKEYIIDNIIIKLVDSIPDKWENGEVVYYISSVTKYITL